MNKFKNIFKVYRANTRAKDLITAHFIALFISLFAQPFFAPPRLGNLLIPCCVLFYALFHFILDITREIICRHKNWSLKSNMTIEEIQRKFGPLKSSYHIIIDDAHLFLLPENAGRLLFCGKGDEISSVVASRKMMRKVKRSNLGGAIGESNSSKLSLLLHFIERVLCLIPDLALVSIQIFSLLKLGDFMDKYVDRHSVYENTLDFLIIAYLITCLFTAYSWLRWSKGTREMASPGGERIDITGPESLAIMEANGLHLQSKGGGIYMFTFRGSEVLIEAGSGITKITANRLKLRQIGIILNQCPTVAAA